MLANGQWAAGSEVSEYKLRQVDRDTQVYNGGMSSARQLHLYLNAPDGSELLSLDLQHYSNCHILVFYCRDTVPAICQTANDHQATHELQGKLV